MNRQEAYKILGLNDGASKDEVKKQFRKLAAKYHPDVCKEPGAEDKFKEINKANEILSKDESTYYEEFVDVPFTNRPPVGFNPFFNFFSDFEKNTPRSVKRPLLQCQVDLSFIESVIGCKKEIDVNKFFMCESCKGACVITSDNICSICSGKGKKVTNRKTAVGNITTVESCGACFGIGRGVVPCSGCNGEGSVQKNVKYKVTIQPGVQNGTILRLHGVGNFSGLAYSDIHVIINVQKEENMKLVGVNIMSELDIDLLEALEGVTKQVKTIDGDKDLVIPKLTKNKDQLSISGLGVPNSGNHIFNINVKYPEEIDGLISFLKTK